jgi:4-hydroxybenzoate polyprenyltransferase
MRLKRWLRAHRWWDVQIPVMLAPVYLVLAAADPPPPVLATLGTIAVFLVASIGIAGFGHLVNDLFDIEQDRASGAPNLAASRGRTGRILLLATLLAIALVPWLRLPTSPAIWTLLAAEFALFLLYSVPPVRLKERGVLGPVADALYSWTISTAVALLLFAGFAGVHVAWWMSSLLAAWAFTLGLRHILTHQIEDVGRDEAAGMRTFVSRLGWRDSFRLLERVLLPAEVTLFAIILAIVAPLAPLVPLGFVVHAALAWRRERVRALDRTVAGTAEDVQVHRLFFWNITVLHRFYTHWFPLLALATLVRHEPAAIVLLVIHLAVFENGFVHFLRDGLPRLLGSRTPAEVVP